jgi:hypothetical protein
MGLPAVWLRVAEEIGPEKFDALWRILDAEPSIRREDGAIEARLRPYNSYLRYQRNRFIEDLHRSGLALREIQAIVLDRLCEKVSLRHISRLATGK